MDVMSFVMQALRELFGFVIVCSQLLLCDGFPVFDESVRGD